MNRDEAKQLVVDNKVGGHLSVFSINSKSGLIDKIYDDFESRVCESCMYFKLDAVNYGNIDGECLASETESSEPIIKTESKHAYAKESECYKGWLEVSRDFGCNRWEEKHE